MASIHPHINFNGNAEEAFHFYQSIFGGSFTQIIRFRDIASPEFPIAEKDADKLMHIALSFGSSVLIGNDVPEFMGRVNENENRSKISVSTDSMEEALRIYKGLTTGAKIEVPFDGSPDSGYFGMFRDRYGIEWIVEFNQIP